MRADPTPRATAAPRPPADPLALLLRAAAARTRSARLRRWLRALSGEGVETRENCVAARPNPSSATISDGSRR